jgi:hypothetical protein
VADPARWAGFFFAPSGPFSVSPDLTLR